jgi:hypothetical protein
LVKDAGQVKESERGHGNGMAFDGGERTAERVRRYSAYSYTFKDAWYMHCR